MSQVGEARNFAVLKSDVVSHLNEGQKQSAESSRQWHALVHTILASLPPNISKSANFPPRVYGYEYSVSGPEQIRDFLLELEVKGNPLYLDGTPSQAAIDYCLSKEAEYYDEARTGELSTRGLARVRNLGAIKRTTASPLSNPSQKNTALYRAASTEGTGIQLTSYGHAYLQHVLENYPDQL